MISTQILSLLKLGVFFINLHVLSLGSETERGHEFRSFRMEIKAFLIASILYTIEEG